MDNSRYSIIVQYIDFMIWITFIRKWGCQLLFLLKLHIRLVNSNDWLAEESVCLLHVSALHFILAIQSSDCLRQADHTLQLTYSNSPRRLRCARRISLSQLLVLLNYILLSFRIDLQNIATPDCFSSEMSSFVLVLRWAWIAWQTWCIAGYLQHCIHVLWPLHTFYNQLKKIIKYRIFQNRFL